MSDTPMESYSSLTDSQLHSLASLAAGMSPSPYAPFDVEAIRSVLIEVSHLRNERDMLRKALIDAGRAAGCLLTDDVVSSNFLAKGVPGEVKSKLTHVQDHEYIAGYRNGLMRGAQVCSTAATLCRSVLECDCFDVARLYDIRGKEIEALIPMTAADAEAVLQGR
jgi:hypothetical protein